jgi:hypothetical protein
MKYTDIKLLPNEQVILEVRPDLRYRYQFFWGNIRSIFVYLCILFIVGHLNKAFGDGHLYAVTRDTVQTLQFWLTHMSTNARLGWGLGILGVGLGIFMCYTTRLKQYHYRFTNQCCIIQTGLWRNKVYVLPLDAEYRVKIFCSFLEKRLQLYRILLIQKKSDNSKGNKLNNQKFYWLEGLSQAEAKQMINLIKQYNPVLENELKKLA